jgi:hypothetical protein
MYHFDPVPIGIQDECEKLQVSVRQTLFERHSESLEARARRLNIGHRDRDMTEPARLGIARMVLHRGIVLRAVVVSKLEDSYERARETRHWRDVHTQEEGEGIVGDREGPVGRRHTFAVKTAFFYLRICGFATSVIEGEEVKRKIGKINSYSKKVWYERLRKVSGEPVIRRKEADLLAFDEIHSNNLILEKGGRER